MRGNTIVRTGNSDQETVELETRMKERDAPACIDTKVFLERFRGMSSQAILDELAAIGRGPDWFAREVADLFSREDVTGRLRLRLLDLVRKIVVQDEGVKIKREQMDRASDHELEALVTEIKAKYGLKELPDAEHVAARPQALAAGGERAETAKSRSPEALPAPACRAAPASIDRTSASLERREQKRKNHVGRR